MSNNFELKKQVVADITKKFQDAKSVVVVNYSGLTVEQVTALRAQCRAANVDYCVLKNTLARRALDDLNITGLDEVLNGPSAFALFTDGDFFRAVKQGSARVVTGEVEAFDATGVRLRRMPMTAQNVREALKNPA